MSLDGVTFYGSPWTPPFMQWYFMADEIQLANFYERMPMAIDVLITHGPPYGVLDPGWNGVSVGSTALAGAIGRRQVRYHVFGHLYGAGGQMTQKANTTYYNVAACDEQYKLRNQLLYLRPDEGATGHQEPRPSATKIASRRIGFLIRRALISNSSGATLYEDAANSRYAGGHFLVTVLVLVFRGMLDECSIRGWFFGSSKSSVQRIGRIR